MSNQIGYVLVIASANYKQPMMECPIRMPVYIEVNRKSKSRKSSL